MNYIQQNFDYLPCTKMVRTSTATQQSMQNYSLLTIILLLNSLGLISIAGQEGSYLNLKKH